jgi:hypothetical protein
MFENVSIAGIVPLSWTSIWNYASNSTQYQPATDEQYQSGNEALGIFLSGLWDEAPFTLARTAIAVSAGPGAALAVTPPGPAGAGSAAQVGSPAEAPAQESPGVAPAATSTAVPSIAPAGGDDDGRRSRRSGMVSGFETGEEAGAGPLVWPGRSVGYSSSGAATDGLRRESDPARSSAPSATTERASPARAERARSATPSRQPAPTDREVPSAPTSAAASAAPGTGSSGGGLPVFLALPFLAAVLDLARRAALERAAWPSGHPARIPDTPG